jgi:hypothetical protein
MRTTHREDETLVDISFTDICVKVQTLHKAEEEFVYDL